MDVQDSQEVAQSSVPVTPTAAATPTTTVASPTVTKRASLNRKSSSQRRARSNSHNVHGHSGGYMDAHHEALTKIRQFLKTRSAFDVFPLSYRLVVFDTKLTVKYALNTMHQYGLASVAIYNQKQWKFAGMFTLLDIIHLIQYYYLKAENFESAAADVETFKIESLRNIEDELNLPHPSLHSIHPSRPLYEACKLLLQSHARRLPLIDHDAASDMELIAAVLTPYRLMKFVANNCNKEIQNLNHSLRSLGIGTYVEPKPDDPYYPLAYATMDTTVFNVVHLFSEKGIGAIPIIDETGVVKNVFETLDVTTLVRSGTYTKLDLSIHSAIAQRSADFQGAIICTGSDSLGKLLELIGARRVHRLVVVDAEGRLAGMITLTDIIKYLVGVRDMTGQVTMLPTATEEPTEVEE